MPEDSVPTEVPVSSGAGLVPVMGASPSLDTVPGPGRRSHPLVRFAVRRLLSGLLTMIVASMLIYGAVTVLPGDVVQVALGREATPQMVAQLTANLHLNQSLPERYVRWLTNIVTGHLGDSTAALAQGEVVPVWQNIRVPLGNSLMLAALTMLLFIPLCLLFGTLAALRAGRAVDHGISTISLAVGAMPEFLVGTMLIVIFFTELHLLPPISTIAPGATPLSNPKGLILPVVTLLGVSLSFGTRLVRASMIEAMREDSVLMARLNGVPERRVIWRYGLRNALGPSVQIMAQMTQYLVGGIIVVENVFAYPGIGTAVLQAVNARDIQEVSVIAAILAGFYILINIVADMLVVLLVPKLRTAGS